MSRLDEELRAAVDASEAEATRDEAPDSTRPVAAARATRSATSGQPAKRSIGLLVALLVIGGGLLALVFLSFGESAVYSRGVAELLEERDATERALAQAQGGEPVENAREAQERFWRRNTRVKGFLVKGSLTRREEPCEYRFEIHSGGKSLPVRYTQCVVPDTFRDVPDMDVEVTVTGKLSAEGFFQADTIMAKCPSKYEMKQRAAAGEAAPHGELPGEGTPGG